MHSLGNIFLIWVHRPALAKRRRDPNSVNDWIPGKRTLCRTRPRKSTSQQNVRTAMNARWCWPPPASPAALVLMVQSFCWVWNLATCPAQWRSCTHTPWSGAPLTLQWCSRQRACTVVRGWAACSTLLRCLASRWPCRMASGGSMPSSAANSTRRWCRVASGGAPGPRSPCIGTARICWPTWARVSGSATSLRGNWARAWPGC